MTARVRTGSPLRKITSPTPTYVTEYRSPTLTYPELRKGPYTVYQTESTLYQPHATRSEVCLPGSSFSNQSQTTMVAPPAAASTVRLVTEAERCSPDVYPSSGIESPGSSWSGSQPGDRGSLVTELVSSYLTDMGSDGEASPTQARSRITLRDEPVPPRERRSKEREPQLSWFLTLFLLTVVTVVCSQARVSSTPY